MAGDGSNQSQSVWPLPKFRFRVTWDSAEVLFQEVSGLDVDAQPTEYRARDTANFSAVKLPGLRKSGNITMKWSVLATDNPLFDWFSEVQMNTFTRKTLTIALVDAADTPTMVWTVRNAFPVKISGTNLKAEGKEIAVEAVEIAYESLTISNA